MLKLPQQVIFVNCIPFEIQLTKEATSTNKSAYIRARIEPSLKANAEAVFAQLGIIPIPTINRYKKRPFFHLALLLILPTGRAISCNQRLARHKKCLCF
jgi:hypothetical protein